MASAFVAPMLACIAIAVGIMVVAFAFRFLTRKKSPSFACPRCLYDVSALAGAHRCPECGHDLEVAGVIAPGTPVRERLPLWVQVTALGWLFLAGACAMGNAMLTLNVLQSERRTFQALLVCSDPGLDISASWWENKHPFSPAAELVQLSPMQRGGRLTQHYADGKPSTWELEAAGQNLSFSSGSGEASTEQLWSLLGASPAERNDPTMQARIDALRAILLGGKALAPPAGSDWRATNPFGPSYDQWLSTPGIIIIAAIPFLAWIGGSLWLQRASRTRIAYIAPTVPLSAPTPTAQAP